MPVIFIQPAIGVINNGRMVVAPGDGVPPSGLYRDRLDGEVIVAPSSNPYYATVLDGRFKTSPSGWSS